jgi:hypothetical protein
MTKKRAVMAGVVSVVGVGLLVGAYLVGLAVADPTTTPEYAQMSKDLAGERAELVGQRRPQRPGAAACRVSGAGRSSDLDRA